MAKWGWKARFAHIDECCYVVNELDDMPSWDNLTLEEALEIARDVAEHCDEDNGDWETDSYDKKQYKKCLKFIKDFG